MLFLKIFMGVFILTESLNILELYFDPDRDVFHGVSFFKGWNASKENDECHLLLNYFVNWVAGVKLIVVLLLAVLVFTASDLTLIYVAIALVIAIASFYWRMWPILKQMDKKRLCHPTQTCQTSNDHANHPRSWFHLRHHHRHQLLIK